ncbi:MAG: ATPase [Amylibacter sp.]|nr:ATPase [Amylibacter sp.]
MAEWDLKVFWSEVTVCEGDAGFKVLLDERDVKTPAKSTLQVPTRAFAEKIAAEWASLEDKVDPEKLPLTKLANAAIDKVVVQSDPIIGMLSEYGTTDLLCYRATAPKGLADKQEQVWQPLLDWFAATHGITLEVGSGVMPIRQPTEVLGKCAALLKPYTAFELAAVYDLISLSGSFVIGLATACEKLDAPRAWAASRIDEDWQISEWGADEDATILASTRQQAFERAAFVLSLLK